MLAGIHGKILHIDLSLGTVQVENPPEEVYRLLVGGRGLIAYLLLRDLPPGTDPLSPDNLLIFAPGILQGTSLPGAGRHGVGGKSPLTGAIASSEAGGWWGHEFKRTGYDALVIRGRADTPVYILIQDQDVQIRPADHLWGRHTHPVQVAIQEELGDERIRVAQIGPAGENQVRYAAVMHDVNRAAGRNGLGALMGSKNLKAVAVRGTTRVPIAERQPFNETARWLGANYKTLAAWATSPGRGTQDSLMNWAYKGGLPVRNFSEPVFENPELLSGERNYEMFLKERDTCQACPIDCKQVFEHDDENPYRKLDPAYGGPEYEAMSGLGSNCGVEDNLAVAKANELCNANGLDAISTGASIAFAMECFERGIIDETITGGIAFRWGDGELLLRAVELIAAREGFGDLLAEGVDRMSARFGPESAPYNLTVKSQELPMHEPRLKHVLGVGYAISPIGADHMANVHDTAFVSQGEGLRRVNSVLEKPIGPVSNKVLNEDKLQIFYNELNWMHFQDCAINCHFYPYRYEHLAQALSGVTGVDYSVRDILRVGERAQTLARLFNLREGFRADDDRLPKRVRKAFQKGPLAGVEITDEDFAWARQRYYQMMGWDPQTGVPGPERMLELGLPDLLPDLE